MSKVRSCWLWNLLLKSLASLLEPCIACFPKSSSTLKRLDRDKAKSGASIVVGLERWESVLSSDTSFLSSKQVSLAAGEWTNCGVHSGTVFQAEI